MVEIEITQHAQWVNTGSTWFRGGGFIEGKYYDAEKAASEIEARNNIQACIEFLQRLNGFFAVIFRNRDTLLLSVDHLCSIPLYYSVEDSVYVSDSSDWVSDNSSGGHDPYAATELLYTMFVTGPDTIGESTKQLQAGEYVVLDTNQQEVNDRRRYHRLDLGNGSAHPRDKSFDEVFQNVGERLVEFADGRTICVALSGGSDSRLIALLLAQTGYDNVVTYTHDLPSGDANDIPVARAVSKKLGFEHVTLNLDHDDYREFYDSDEWAEFYQTVDYLANVPNVHETVVLQKLMEEANLSANPVDVRGHLPIPHGRDAFLPAILEHKPLISKAEFFDFLWNGHYIRWKAEQNPAQWKKYLCHRGLSNLPMDLFADSSIEESSDIAAALSQWYCQERAAKYLAFDLEYDFVGFDRWHPLWDQEYISLLRTLDLSHIIHKRAHSSYVESLSTDILGRETAFNPATTASNTLTENATSRFWQGAKQGINALPSRIEYRAKNVGRSVLWQFTRGYESDPRYGLVEKERFEQFDLDRYDAETFYYLLLFQDGAFDLPDWVEIQKVT